MKFHHLHRAIFIGVFFICGVHINAQAGLFINDGKLTLKDDVSILIEGDLYATSNLAESGIWALNQSQLILKGDLRGMGTSSIFRNNDFSHLIFSGTQSQNILHTNQTPLELHKITLQNPNGVSSHINLSINDTLTFSKGLLDLNGRELTMKLNSNFSPSRAFGDAHAHPWIKGESKEQGVINGDIVTEGNILASLLGSKEYNFSNLGFALQEPGLTHVKIKRSDMEQTIEGGESVKRYFDISTTAPINSGGLIKINYLDRDLQTYSNQQNFEFYRHLLLPSGELDGSATWENVGITSLNANEKTATLNNADAIYPMRWTLYECDNPEIKLTLEKEKACTGDSIRLSVEEIPGTSISWSTGETTNEIIITATTEVSMDIGVKVMAVDGCFSVDTAHLVFTQAPSVNFVEDKIEACQGELISLSPVVEGNHLNYEWSTGESTSSITIPIEDTSTQIIEVRVSVDNECSDTDDIIIKGLDGPVVNLGNDTTVCTRSSILLDAGPGANLDYLWSPGNSVGQTLKATRSDFYTVEVTNSLTGCKDRDSIDVKLSRLFVTRKVTSPSCSGGDNGSIELNIQSGTPPYQIKWNTQDTGRVLSNLLAGDYSVTVTDGVGCMKVFSRIRVPDPKPLTVSYSKTDDFCREGNAGITLHPKGGTPPFEFEWTNSFDDMSYHTKDIDGLLPGMYQLFLNDANGCTFLDSINIEGPYEQTSYNIHVTDIQCSNNEEGRVAIEDLVGGNLPYQFLWNTGDTEYEITNVEAGEYSVTVTDAKDCLLLSETIEVRNQNFLDVKIDRTHPTCDGAKDGSLTVYAPDAVLPIDILWSTGSEEATLNQLDEDFYSVTVTDNSGCTGNATIQLNAPNLLSARLDAVDHIDCAGQSEGALYITPLGDIGPYSYDWSHDGPDIIDDDPEDITGLKSGEYTVTITSLNGCQVHQAFHIDSHDSIEIKPNIVYPVCGQTIYPALSADIVGGAAPYQYNWSTGDTEPILTDIAFGEYRVTVTDNNSCQSTSVIQLDQIEPISATLNSVEPRCAGDSSLVSLQVAGGVAPYTFVWSDGLSTIGNLAWADGGSYSVDIRDQRGCLAQIDFSLAELNRIEIQAIISPESMTNALDGSIESTISGGSPPYDLLWNTGETSMNLFNLSKGQYSLSVTDDVGCQQVATFKVQEAPSFNLRIHTTSPTCPESADGRIDVTVSHGEGPFTYLWSTGETNPNIESITTGIYSLTITDAVDRDTIVDIPISSVHAISYGTVITPEQCAGANNGSAVTHIAGEEAFDLIFDGQVEPNLTEMWQRTDLAPGNYPFSMTSIYGCQVFDTLTILAAEGLTLEQSSYSPLSDFSELGQITVDVQGGQPPYRYEWSSGQRTAMIEDLNEGEYILTVTDDNGCTRVQLFRLEQVASLNAHTTRTHNTCGATNIGQISLSVQGGQPPYSILWSTGDTTENLVAVAAGTFTANISDAEGRNISVTEEVYQFDSIRVETEIDEIQCSGSASGGIKLFAFGGIPPYQFEWSTGHSGPEVHDLIAGTYNVTVSDEFSCQATLTIELDDRLPLSINKTVKGLSVVGGSDGEISCVVQGGQAPYSTVWSNGALSNEITNLSEGWYEVIVIDQAGCALVDSTYIQHSFGSGPPLTIQIDSGNVSCFGFDDGYIDITVKGGTAPYEYEWSTGEKTEDLLDIIAATYAITVTDAVDSTLVTSINITQPPELSIILNALPISCHGAEDGSITADIQGGTEPYFYEWNTGDDEPEIEVLFSGIYELEVTDANDCFVSADTMMEEPSELSVILEVEGSGCDEQSGGTIRAITMGGTAPYSYRWSTGDDIDEVVEGLEPGNYQVTIIDNQGCEVTSAATVEMAAEMLRARFLAASPVKAGDTVQFIDLSYPIPTSWEWHFGDERGRVSSDPDPQFIYENNPNEAESLYDVTLIVDNGSCIDSLTKTIRIINTRSGAPGPTLPSPPEVTVINEFELFPNPTVDQFYAVIGLNQKDDILVELFSTTGKLIEKVQYVQKQILKHEFATTGLSAGSYIIRVTAGRDSVSKPLIKITQ